VGPSTETIILETKTITISDAFIGHSGNAASIDGIYGPSTQTLTTTLDLGYLNADFNTTKTIRLVSLSMEGDLDNGATERITSGDGLRIGGVLIINNANGFLNSINNHHVILPENLNQVDNYALNHQSTNVNNIIELGNVSFPSSIATGSVQMADGLVEVTMSIDEGISTSYPILLTATFEYDVFEEVSTTQYEDIMMSPTFSFGLNQPTPLNDNLAFSVRSSSTEFIDGNDGLPRKTIAYTSSWVELQTPTGSFELLPSFISSSTTSFTSSLDFLNSQSANVTMSNALPTQLVDLRYETEMYGYAGSGSNDINMVTETTRSVLYGDSHITNADSESAGWSNHPSASTYASHSVTRFRVRGRIVEPFGPATSITDVTLKLPSSTNSDHDFNAGIIQSINTDAFILAENYDNNNKLNTPFTSSFTNNVSLNANASNTANSVEDYIVSGTVSYNINTSLLPGTNIMNVSPPVTSNIQVKDTQATYITINKIETETFGESNVGINNNNSSNPGIISRSILYNEDETRATGSGVEDLFSSAEGQEIKKAVENLSLKQDALTNTPKESKSDSRDLMIIGAVVVVALALVMKK
jgi:hypothetical protein